jgi:hypothetical protein
MDLHSSNLVVNIVGDPINAYPDPIAFPGHQLLAASWPGIIS